LATFVVAKILSFPLVKYANEAKRNKIKWTVTIIAVLSILHAKLTFITFIEKSNQDRDIRNFIKNEIKSNEELFYSNHEVNYDKKKISFTFFSELPDETIADLKNEKKSYEYIKDFKFRFKGNKIKSFDLISTAYQDSQKRIEQKNNVIKGLQGTIENLKAELESKNKKLPLDFLKISKEAKINFYDLNNISFSKELRSDFKKIDTLPTARVTWRSLLIDSLALKRNNKLTVWLQNEMKLDTIYVKN
jgi:hypothetical protein